MKKLILLLSLAPLTLLGLEKEPWLGNLYEFQLDSLFTYWRYHKIQNGCPQLTHPANNQLYYTDLSVAPASDWAVDIDLELANTQRRSFGFQSSAAQFRLLWLDDVVGDPVSLTTGASFRGVSGISVRDVNSPYHSYANLEINAALGKELKEDAPFWRVRAYAFGALGMANRGSPWARGNVYFQINDQDRHRFSLHAESYWGFGSKRSVNVDNFHGYAKIHHQSIDVGLEYKYLFKIWGALAFDYTRRVYAKSFPENVNFFTIRYTLPFSFF